MAYYVRPLSRSSQIGRTRLANFIQSLETASQPGDISDMLDEIAVGGCEIEQFNDNSQQNVHL